MTTHADAHVGRHHDGDVASRRRESRRGRAAENPVVPITIAALRSAAGLHVRERALGAREIDEHVGTAERRGDIGPDLHARGGDAKLARIVARERACRHVEARAQQHAGRQRSPSPGARGPCGRRRRRSRRGRAHLMTGAAPSCLPPARGPRGGASPSKLTTFSFSKKIDRRLGLSGLPRLHVAEVVVPPVLVERVDQQRRAQQLAHLRLRHPGLELRDQVVGHVIALLDVDRVDEAATAQGDGEQHRGEEAHGNPAEGEGRIIIHA